MEIDSFEVNRSWETRFSYGMDYFREANISLLIDFSMNARRFSTLREPSQHDAKSWLIPVRSPD